MNTAKTIIPLSGSDFENHEVAVTLMCERETYHNADLNGSTFQVVLCDFTSIDGCDEIAGASLLAKISRIVGAL